ncbi:MAG: hypothetical protein AB1508_17410 [Pseudomonadota bacterium]
MRKGWASLTFVGALALGLGSAGAEAASRHHHHATHYSSYRNVGGMSVGVMEPGKVYSKYGHYQELVGDPHGGVGFYPLPYQYRVGAWRYHMRNAPPPWAVPPVIAAARAQAVENYSWQMPTPDSAYSYGVYNPVDGVGSPFFAGYYGPAGDDDDDDSGFPFGHPYPQR